MNISIWIYLYVYCVFAFLIQFCDSLFLVQSHLWSDDSGSAWRWTRAPLSGELTFKLTSMLSYLAICIHALHVWGGLEFSVIIGMEQTENSDPFDWFLYWIFFQAMYAMESVDLPRFRRYMEDMYYNHMPSTFSIHTAYGEVCWCVLFVQAEHCWDKERVKQLQCWPLEVNQWESPGCLLE